MDEYTQPEFTSAVLVTIDTQNDVLDGQPFEIAGTSAVLPQMRVLTEAFRRASRPIVHVLRLYQPDGKNVDLCRRSWIESGVSAVRPGTEGSQLAADILPDPTLRLDADLLLRGEIQGLTEHEVAIYKPRWGAFYQTPLSDHLGRLAVTTLVFAGCNFPNCPRTSIYEASERDYRIVIATDAVSGLYQQGERELSNIGVALMTADEIVQALALQRV